MRKAARKVKQYALNLQTTNLRTAYAELADVCGDALTEKALNRAVRAAIEERTRYHAERIARTEAARAWYDGYIARTQDDDDVWGYRWVLSSRHALVPFDQCDVCANANVGYGKGVYPKNKVPSIPRHPHCMCSLVDVIAGETEGQSRKMNEDGARGYIDSLSDRELMQLFGVDGRETYKHGGDWQNLLRGWDGFVQPVSRLNPEWFMYQTPENPLPNFENAVIADSKIFGYALNKSHAVGKDKALVFDEVLGYNQSNGRELIKAVLEALPHVESIPREITFYGKKYRCVIPMRGPSGRWANVITGWQVDHGADFPRLTTIFVDKK